MAMVAYLAGHHINTHPIPPTVTHHSFLPQRFFSIVPVSSSLLDRGDTVVNETDQFLPPGAFSLSDIHRAIHTSAYWSRKWLIIVLDKWGLPV